MFIRDILMFLRYILFSVLAYWLVGFIIPQM